MALAWGLLEDAGRSAVTLSACALLTRPERAAYHRGLPHGGVGVAAIAQTATHDAAWFA